MQGLMVFFIVVYLVSFCLLALFGWYACFPKQVGFVWVVARKDREEIIGQVESWSH